MEIADVGDFAGANALVGQIAWHPTFDLVLSMGFEARGDSHNLMACCQSVRFSPFSETLEIGYSLLSADPHSDICCKAGAVPCFSLARLSLVV